MSCVLRLAYSGHHAQLPEKWASGPMTRLLNSTNEQLEEQHDEKIQHERNQLRANLFSIEYINTINEGLLIYHVEHACLTMEETDYVKFLKKSVLEEAHRLPQEDRQPAQLYYPRIHTLFSGECTPYFDWQIVGLVHSFKHNF
jgi:DNA-dependent RNA polymerase auxiliary subunit epsilon